MASRLFNIISFETFRSEATEWKRFGKWLFLVVLLPLLLLFLLVEIVAWRSGEMIPPEAAARMQTETPGLRWLGSRESLSARFKLIRVDQERPDVLIMGASRMCQFRREMFRPYSFYNLARVSWPLNTFPTLFRHLPEGYTPKVIIFGLDFFMFNPRYTTDPELSPNPPIYSASPLVNHLITLNDTFITLYGNPAGILADGRDPLTGGPVIGLGPSINSTGFRLDGSETQSNSDLIKYNRHDRAFLRGNMLNVQPLYYGDAMGKEEMAQFEEFAALARARGIKLIAVQMPMYGPVVRYLENDPHFGILKDFRAHIASGYFDRLGVTVFDYLSLPVYGDDDHYFMDIWHPTEPISGAVLYLMHNDPRFRAVLPDLDAEPLRQKLLEEVSGNQHVYLYPRD